MYQDKKPLRQDYMNFEVKEPRKAVSLSEESVDPDMDQRTNVTVYTLRSCTEGVVSQEWRRYWMDGSDCDDGGCHSEAHLGYEISPKHRPVPAVIFI